jgi:hypothetical protein
MKAHSMLEEYWAVLSYCRWCDRWHCLKWRRELRKRTSCAEEGESWRKLTLCMALANHTLLKAQKLRKGKRENIVRYRCLSSMTWNGENIWSEHFYRLTIICSDFFFKEGTGIIWWERERNNLVLNATTACQQTLKEKRKLISQQTCPNFSVVF